MKQFLWASKSFLSSDTQQPFACKRKMKRSHWLPKMKCSFSLQLIFFSLMENCKFFSPKILCMKKSLSMKNTIKITSNLSSPKKRANSLTSSVKNVKCAKFTLANKWTISLHNTLKHTIIERRERDERKKRKKVSFCIILGN